MIYKQICGEALHKLCNVTCVLEYVESEKAKEEAVFLFLWAVLWERRYLCFFPGKSSRYTEAETAVVDKRGLRDSDMSSTEGAPSAGCRR